jgi:ribosomal protein S21
MKQQANKTSMLTTLSKNNFKEKPKNKQNKKSQNTKVNKETKR